jgi:hypothetical protein
MLRDACGQRGRRGWQKSWGRSSECSKASPVKREISVMNSPQRVSRLRSSDWACSLIFWLRCVIQVVAMEAAAPASEPRTAAIPVMRAESISSLTSNCYFGRRSSHAGQIRFQRIPQMLQTTAAGLTRSRRESSITARALRSTLPVGANSRPQSADTRREYPPYLESAC